MHNSIYTALYPTDDDDDDDDDDDPSVMQCCANGEANKICQGYKFQDFCHGFLMRLNEVLSRAKIERIFGQNLKTCFFLLCKIYHKIRKKGNQSSHYITRQPCNKSFICHFKLIV